MSAQSNNQQSKFGYVIEPQTIIKDKTTVISKLNELFKDDEANSIKYSAVLIGSRAMIVNSPLIFKLNNSIRPYIINENTDWDVVMSTSYLQKCLPQLIDANLTLKIYSNTVIVLLVQTNNATLDIEIGMKKGGSADIILSYTNRFNSCSIKIPYLNKKIGVASNEILEAIKTSHIYFSNNHAKHINILHALRGKIGSYERQAKFLNDIVSIRRKEKEDVFGVPGAKINLNQSSEDFLEKNNQLLVERMIKHDDIHKLVALSQDHIPLYRKILSDPDSDSAKCSKEKWDKLSLDEQLDDVREEAMVLALERFVLPKLIIDTNQAYIEALSKVCTTVTKGWFREFAINHYPLLTKCPLKLSELASSIISDFEKTKREEELKMEKESTIESRLKEYLTDNEFKSIKKYEAYPNIDGAVTYYDAGERRSKHKYSSYGYNWGNNTYEKKEYNPNDSDKESDEEFALDDEETKLPTSEYYNDSDNAGGYHNEETCEKLDRIHILHYGKESFAVYTTKSVSGNGSCSVEYNWNANIICLEHDSNVCSKDDNAKYRKYICHNIRKRIKHNINYWSDADEINEKWIFTINPSSSHGDSFGGNDYYLHVDIPYHTDSQNDPLLMVKIICGIFNPKMVYGGNIVLQEELKKWKKDGLITINDVEHNYERQHMWTKAFLAHKYRN